MRIMRTFLILIIICLTLDFTVSGQTGKKTILGIFPHPDDENMIGPVLAKYSRLGHNVYIIIATDGKDGTRVTKIPDGDLSRPEIGLHELTCKRDEKIR